MKKMKKHSILEAVDRGILLALDDYEDNILLSKKVGKYDKEFSFPKKYVRYEELKKLFDCFIIQNIGPNEDIPPFLSKEEYLEFEDLSFELNISYKFEIAERLKGAIKNITKYNKHANLNYFDISEIYDMSYVFFASYFEGDISKWNVGHVTNMLCMFKNANFNGDISNWDVSNVKNMEHMFANSQFNLDISKWNMSNVENISYMFESSNFDKDLSDWELDSIVSFSLCIGVFGDCPISLEHKPLVVFAYNKGKASIVESRNIELELDDYDDMPIIARKQSVYDDKANTKSAVLFLEYIDKLKNRKLETPGDVVKMAIYSRLSGVKYIPKDRIDLIETIRYIVGNYDPDTLKFKKGIDNFANLNWIDVSGIDDLSTVFAYLDFYGDISEWDVSNVTNMFGTFMHSPMTMPDISKWNVSKVETMEQMFCNSKFNGDISKWNVSNVLDMKMMFFGNKEFCLDISKWDVSNVEDKQFIWGYTSKMKDEFKPKFNH